VRPNSRRANQRLRRGVRPVRSSIFLVDAVTCQEYPGRWRQESRDLPQLRIGVVEAGNTRVTTSSQKPSLWMRAMDSRTGPMRPPSSW